MKKGCVVETPDMRICMIGVAIYFPDWVPFMMVSYILSGLGFYFWMSFLWNSGKKFGYLA